MCRADCTGILRTLNLSWGLNCYRGILSDWKRSRPLKRRRSQQSVSNPVIWRCCWEWTSVLGVCWNHSKTLLELFASSLIHFIRSSWYQVLYMCGCMWVSGEDLIGKLRFGACWSSWSLRYESSWLLHSQSGVQPFIPSESKHNQVNIRHHGHNTLFDPWFSKEGVFTVSMAAQYFLWRLRPAKEGPVGQIWRPTYVFVGAPTSSKKNYIAFFLCSH